MQVELHPEAQAETRRAAIWYDERRLGLGDRFLAAVTGTLAGIAATPRAHPIWVALKRPPMLVRRARVTGFPYLVAFEVSSRHCLGAGGCARQTATVVLVVEACGTAGSGVRRAMTCSSGLFPKGPSLTYAGTC